MASKINHEYKNKKTFVFLLRLQVGILDSLLRVSDDLSKLDTLTER